MKKHEEVNTSMTEIRKFLDEHITNGKKDIVEIKCEKSDKSVTGYEYIVKLKTNGYAFDMDKVKDLKWIQVFSDNKAMIQTVHGDIYLEFIIPTKVELERMYWKLREISREMKK